MYLAANFFGINCATGMSALMRKDILEAEGGLRAFGRYLAEDYFMAQAVQDRGMYTVICSQPALQNAGDSSIQLFQNRIIRYVVFFLPSMPHEMAFCLYFITNLSCLLTKVGSWWFVA